MDPDFLKRDFSDFLKSLKNENVSKEIFSDKNVLQFKKMHSIIYSVLILNKRIRSKNNSNVFFDEILSDYIQIMPLLIKGYDKVCIYFLRDIIENCLKYIYYYDHPIEFSWLEIKDKYYIQVNDLLKYIDIHPRLEKYKKEFELSGKMKDEYFDLSKYVHSRNRNYMHLWRCLDSIKFDNNFKTNYYERFIKVSNIVIVLIILFNIEKFKKIEIHEKRIILNSLNKTYKRYIQSI